MSILLLPLLTGCSEPFVETVDDVQLDDAFQRAAADYGVPRDLLVSISYAISRFDHRMGAESTDSGVGLMHLRVNGQTPSIAHAAEITGMAEDDLINDPTANIRGGAAILAGMAMQYGAWTGEEVDTLQEWYPIVAGYSGATDPLVAQGFAAQVFDFMQWGVGFTTPDGEYIEVEPLYLDWLESGDDRAGSSLIDQYIPASSSNYSDYSRTEADITTVVIHTIEGSYSGAISWLQSASAGVSAHYIVRSSDGEITQMVDEEDVAWHAGHWDTNASSIGIEHEGYISQPDAWYTDAMYRASAALTRDICDRNNIPKDRDHIIGHYEVPGCAYSGGGGASCHTDPGSGWDWDYYMSLVNEEGGVGEEITSPLADGPKVGSFSATVTSSRYGITDTCAGVLEGSASNGRLYLTGTCRLADHGDQVGDIPVTFSGEVGSSSSLSGTVAVDGYTGSWTGSVASDGSASGSLSGSQDLGGDVGELTYSATLIANP